MDQESLDTIEQELEELEFEVQELTETETVDEELPRKIYTDQGDPEIDSLHGKYKRGRLNVQPDFQRQFVWDRTKSSRLIESTLLDIPLPVIYLAEEEDGTENVIDGQQRLTSFFAFLDGVFPDGKDFKLSGMKVFSELNGKTYSEIDEIHQDKIRYSKIRSIIFKKESDKDLQFEVFERLNTGAVSLNDQEIRNCIYRGKFNDLLKDLAQDPIFKSLLGQKGPDKRMNDVGLVLRFASFYFNTYLNYKPSIKKFLNKTMEKYRDISDEDATQLTNAFKKTTATIQSLLGEHAFKRFYPGELGKHNGRWEQKRFNTSLYDILMDSFAKADKNNVYQNLDSIREAFIDLMSNDDAFVKSILLSTSSKQAVTLRFDKWRMTLEKLIDVNHREPRLFSRSFKEELFANDPTCAICQNRIEIADDAAVDHVEQYWLGGKTIPDNARLTHRYCNYARSKHDIAPQVSIKDESHD